MRFEASELDWISDFILNNLVFCKSQLKLANDRITAVVLQALWQTLDLFSEETDLPLATQMTSRYERLQSTVKRLHAENEITTAQVVQILEFTRQGIFGHLQLFLTCLKMKKQKVYVKKITVFSEVPQLSEYASLDSDCKEQIVEQQAADLNQRNVSAREEEAQQEPEDVVDPDDPLFGLELRLKSLNLDEESKRIITLKLQEASAKIKTGLEQRQTNLDNKLKEQAAPKKK